VLSAPPSPIRIDHKAVKVHPRTVHEGPEGESRYRSTLFLTWCCLGMGGKCHSPAALPLGKRSNTHCTGGLLGPRAGLNGCDENLGPTGIRSLGRPTCSKSLY
jgi:hypothetical protein